MKLFERARGGSIFTYQSYVYGNCMRLYHLVQILCFFAIASMVTSGTGAELAPYLIYFLLFDWVVFIVLGPVPAPLGTLCLAAIWKMRGPPVPSTPYKIIQAIYVLTYYAIAKDLELSAVEAAAMSGQIANSAYIVIFRF